MASETATASAPAVAYSYIRLSSKRQANAEDQQKYRDGFRRQVQMREEYLAKNPHLTLDTTLVLHDIGVSAYNRDNVDPKKGGKLAAFQRAVEDGRVARGSYLLVESLDRFSRADVSVAQYMLLGLVNAGIIVVSITDGMVYRANRDQPSQDANFLFSVMTLMRAHEESKMKSKRLRSTWEEKRKKVAQVKLTARAPGWLRLVDGRFEPIEHRVETVREILRMLADGYGRDRIAAVLNADGAECWGHGRQWHGGTIQKVTDNRALIGEFQPHKLDIEDVDGVRTSKRVAVGPPIPDYFPRVVSEELWNSARLVADKRRLGRGRNSGGRTGVVCSNLFGGVAVCGLCRKPMVYRDRGPRSTPVLRCSSQRVGACKNDYRFPYLDTEEAILSWIVKVDLSGGAKSELASKEKELLGKIAKREELKARGEAMVRSLSDFMDFAEGPFAELKARRAALDVEIADITGRITALKGAGNRDERETAVGILHDLRRMGAPAEDVYAVRSRLRQMIRDTFVSMHCYPAGDISVHTIDNELNFFRDGFWWHEEDDLWIPSSRALMHGGQFATRAEMARRHVWLDAEDEARKLRRPEECRDTGSED